MRVSFGFQPVLVLLCILGASVGALLPSQVHAFEFRFAAGIGKHVAPNGQGQVAGSRLVPVHYSQPDRELKRSSGTVLARRWAMTRARVQAEADWLQSCEKGACRDWRAATWRKLVSRVEAVPQAVQPALVQEIVNGNIRYLRDEATDDHWANPLSTLLRGAGDCEDHVLLKRAVLTAAGYRETDTRLLILETASGAGHMALEVDADTILVLDNRYRSPRTERSLAGDRVAAIATDRGYFSIR